CIAIRNLFVISAFGSVTYCYQTQLNPHFLYNTLDTIKWSAKIHQIPEIAVLAENLAVILRKSISSKPFIQLREELDTIESYIKIQKIRFAGRFLMRRRFRIC
ncbi:MAG: histidine kinase, partial [Lachnospiraceae bacterium]